MQGEKYMLNFFCAILLLFFCDGMIKSMEACTDISLMPIINCDQYNSIHNYHIAHPVDSKIIKKYAAHGVDTLFIDGSKRGEKDGGRIKLNIVQLTDDNASEEVIVQTEKNISSFVIVNHNGADLEIGLRPTDHMSSKDILIYIALKKYAKIVTKSYVDLTLSMIKADKIHLEVEDNCLVTTDTQLIADSLLINNKGKSHVDLTINTKLLWVNNDNEGTIILNGVATEQDIVLFNGVFDGYNVESEQAFIALGDGAGKICVSANKQITGYLSEKSKHDTTYHIPVSAIYLELLDSIQPIDFKKNDELL